MPVTYEEIISDLKKRIFKPVYFLAGEEPYYIDQITGYIEEHVLDEAEKSFNQVVFYGEETSITNVIETSRRFPMMSTHQVVIVREAQSLRKIEDLIIYAEKPLSSTILVINYKYGTLDKRTRLYKVLDSQGSYFESPRLRDYQVPAWIEKYLSARGIKTDPNASATLTEFLGTDLNKIANELDKLIITLPEGKPVITTSLIEKNIGISKDYNNFELQKAVGEKNILKANTIVRHFAANQKENPMTLTIASLFSFFTRILTYHYLSDKSKNNVASLLKVNPFFVKEYEAAAAKYNVTKTIQIIGLLRTYDMKSKGFGDVSSEPGDLLKELIYKILHI
ncbi:MAG: DNA polymerase III subunit delta [Bacteroidales bacterium]|jgi:DNA polymerase-3 subunit delta|nr:DNA polymerase III subunit delta [Bacteroidales bacterium]